MKLVRGLSSHFGRHEAQINQSFQELTSAKPPPVHRWVRVQDDLHGMRPSSDGSGGLFAPNGRARHTMHGTLDCVVGDHTYGSFNEDKDGNFKGKIILIADPKEMGPPSGFGLVDTWFRKTEDVNPSTGQAEAGLHIGRATVVAPEGTPPIPGAQMLYYDGTQEDRDRVAKEHMQSVGVEVKEASKWSWVGEGSNHRSPDIYQEIYGSIDPHVHFGPHEGSLDGQIEDSIHGGGYAPPTVNDQMAHIRSGGVLSYTDGNTWQTVCVEAKIKESMQKFERDLAPQIHASLEARPNPVLSKMVSAQLENFTQYRGEIASLAASALADKMTAADRIAASLGGNGYIEIATTNRSTGTLEAYYGYMTTAEEFGRRLGSGEFDGSYAIKRSGLNGDAWSPMGSCHSQEFSKSDERVVLLTGSLDTSLLQIDGKGDYFVVDSSPAGHQKMNRSQLITAILLGQANEQSLVWREGMPDWDHLGDAAPAVKDFRPSTQNPRHTEQDEVGEEEYDRQAG